MRDRVVRVLLALMAVSSGFVGAWALLAPRSFYDDFPGGGRHWVSADGPYNEHLVRDVGGLNLALTVVVVVAAIALGRVLVRTAAVATLVFAIPHFAYHSAHTDLYEASDSVATLFSLGLAIVLPIVVLVVVSRPEGGRLRQGRESERVALE
jgi:hypothetical protein